MASFLQTLHIFVPYIYFRNTLHAKKLGTKSNFQGSQGRVTERRSCLLLILPSRTLQNVRIYLEQPAKGTAATGLHTPMASYSASPDTLLCVVIEVWKETSTLSPRSSDHPDSRESTSGIRYCTDGM